MKYYYAAALSPEVTYRDIKQSLEQLKLPSLTKNRLKTKFNPHASFVSVNEEDCPYISNKRERGQIVNFSTQILSDILLCRLTPYADEIIWDHQCGFRLNR
jgi:hypothetical protein